MRSECETTRVRILRHGITTALAGALFIGMGVNGASATEPCDDFGECKMLIEINATDGDIGFHFLADGDDLNKVSLFDANENKLMDFNNKNALGEQKSTEIFHESAEPLCWEDPEADEDEVIVTLEEFVARWVAGTYTLQGFSDGGEKSEGETELTHALPAAPANLDYNVGTGVLSWTAGNDLGNCATNAELTQLVNDGVLPVHPMNVPVAMWEAVFEADDDSGLKSSVRLPVGQTSVTVPSEFLNALPDDTPAKVEVGAIGLDDNATFSEVGDICVNEDEGCEEED